MSTLHPPLARAIQLALASVILCAEPTKALPARIDVGLLNGRNGARLDGIAQSDRTGRVVSPAGDLNGDGIGDFAVGAALADAGPVVDAGAVYVVFGQNGSRPAFESLGNLGGVRGFRIQGAGSNDQLGFATAPAGDINGDGIDDLILGAGDADTAGTDSGAAYVVFGRSSAFPASLSVTQLDGSIGFRLTGAAANDGAGFGVAGVGDFNGDGRDDLAVGAPGFDIPGLGSTGAAFVVYGRNSFPASLALASLDASTGLRIEGAAAGDFAGQRIAAGDINGDGRADLLIGAPGRDDAADRAGSAYVLYGRAGPLPATLNLASINGTNGFRLDGARTEDYAGYNVAVADLNGDGFGDLILAAPNADLPGRPDAGTTHVLFGGMVPRPPSIALDSIAAPAGFRFEGEIGGYSGIEASSAGDVDGDQFADLILTDVSGGELAQGGAHVIRGRLQFPSIIRAADLDGDLGFTIRGALADEYAGISAAGGDFNGDGLGDLLVGSTRRSVNNVDAGVAYLVFGFELFNDSFESASATGGR